MANGPSIDAPMTAVVLRPPSSHRACTASDVGGSSWRTSSSRADDGMAPSCTSGLASTIGDSERATHSSQS